MSHDNRRAEAAVRFTRQIACLLKNREITDEHPHGFEQGFEDTVLTLDRLITDARALLEGRVIL